MYDFSCNLKLLTAFATPEMASLPGELALDIYLFLIIFLYEMFVLL
jgi:hypothetical protein